MDDLSPLRRTRCDWVLEAVSFLCLVWAFVPLFFYGSIGEDVRVPTHYDALGRVDGYGNRSDLWTPALVAAAFYVVLTVIERFYRSFNFPVRVTQANAEALYRLGIRLIRFMKPLLMFIMAYLNTSSFAAAMGRGIGLNSFVMAVLVIAMFALIAYFMAKMYKQRDDTAGY